MLYSAAFAQDAPKCESGTLLIGKKVKLPERGSFTHGKFLNILEEAFLESVKLCGEFAIHEKWTKEAIAAIGTASEQRDMTMEAATEAKAPLASPLVVYRMSNHHVETAVACSLAPQHTCESAA